MVYHAWIDGKVCNGNNRILLVDNIMWDGEGWPAV